jgi:hypothetical protein
MHGCREQPDPCARARRVTRRPIRPSGAESGDDGSIDDLVEAFLHTRDPRQIERGADRLGASGHSRAIPALLARLGDASIVDDADVEDAVCSALVALSVMEREGNLAFALRPIETLPPAAREALAHDVFLSRGATGGRKPIGGASGSRDGALGERQEPSVPPGPGVQRTHGRRSEPARR